MLIADHARKDAPAGSYSWKFIEDSVKYGIIQLKDRYRIGRDPELPRPVGAGGGTKSTRTPFTSAEDAALAKWVLEQPGNSTGNRIFQEYERIVGYNIGSDREVMLTIAEPTTYMAIMAKPLCKETTAAPTHRT